MSAATRLVERPHVKPDPVAVGAEAGRAAPDPPVHRLVVDSRPPAACAGCLISPRTRTMRAPGGASMKARAWEKNGGFARPARVAGDMPR